MRDRLLAAMVLVMLGLGGCLGDPQGVVFGQGDTDLDAGSDVGLDVSEIDTGDVDEVDTGDVDDVDTGDVDDVDDVDTGDVNEPDACSNGQLDGDETDIDCGGSCGGCEEGALCESNGDCSEEELLEFVACDRNGMATCVARGTGVYRAMKLECVGEGSEGTRCVARPSGADPVRVSQDEACEINTDGLSCGEAQVEVGPCQPVQGQVCSSTGTQSVVTYQAECANEICQNVRSETQQACDRGPQIGTVCQSRPWSAWGPCELRQGADSCSNFGVRRRSREVSLCNANGACSTTASEIETEEQACQRTSDAGSCASENAEEGGFVCHQGSCCMPDCSTERLSCRDRVDDGCGGQCQRLQCGNAQNCGTDGTCRTTCGIATDGRACENNVQCAQMCACPLDTSPTCTIRVCACL